MFKFWSLFYILRESLILINYLDQDYMQIAFYDAHGLPEKAAAYSIMVQNLEFKDVVQIRSGMAQNLRRDILALDNLPKWFHKYIEHVVIYYKFI